MIPQIKSMSPKAKGIAAAITAAIGLGVWVGWQQCASATPDASGPEPLAASTQSDDAGTGETVVAAAPAELKTTAEIVFTVVPSTARATVTWGKKKFGRIEPGKPLVVVRPRDSGPLDVIIRADGYLPVHTRAYTFNDTKLSVKLTKPEAQSTLLGYRVPLDAGWPVTPDGLTEPEALPSTETFFP